MEKNPTPQHNDHACEIVTLKNQTHRQAKQSPKKGFVMFTQHISNLQYLSQDGYYIEIANPGLRGGCVSRKSKTGVFNVAVNPLSENPETIRTGMLALLVEKFVNDATVFNALVDELVFDGRISSSTAVKMRIGRGDLAEFLLAKQTMTDEEKAAVKVAVDLCKITKVVLHHE